MNNQIADLGHLEKKLQDEIRALEERTNEVKRRLNIVTEAIELLREGGTFDQNRLFETAVVLSDKYKKISMRKAILDVLQSYHGKKVSAEIIISDLKKNGIVSGAKNFRRDVYTRLFRLKKSGIVGSRKEGGLNRYFLKEEKIEEEVKNEKGGMS